MSRINIIQNIGKLFPYIEGLLYLNPIGAHGSELKLEFCGDKLGDLNVTSTNYYFYNINITRKMGLKRDDTY